MRGMTAARRRFDIGALDYLIYLHDEFGDWLRQSPRTTAESASKHCVIRRLRFFGQPAARNAALSAGLRLHLIAAGDATSCRQSPPKRHSSLRRLTTVDLGTLTARSLPIAEMFYFNRPDRRHAADKPYQMLVPVAYHAAFESARRLPPKRRRGNLIA
jgi:hypothetical protein